MIELREGQELTANAIECKMNMAHAFGYTQNKNDKVIHLREAYLITNNENPWDIQKSISITQDELYKLPKEDLPNVELLKYISTESDIRELEIGDGVQHIYVINNPLESIKMPQSVKSFITDASIIIESLEGLFEEYPNIVLWTISNCKIDNLNYLPINIKKIVLPRTIILSDDLIGDDRIILN